MTTAEMAARLVAAHISVIPVKLDGSKIPDQEWKIYQQRLATPGELQQWFGGHRPKGLGIVAGSVSQNLEVIDFDDLTLAEPWKELIDLECPGLTQRLVLIVTPRPGLQFWYRCEEPVSGNQKLAQRRESAKLVTLIETRGEGGYAVAPGSPPAVHENGVAYKIAGGDPADPPLITVEERALLLRCARSLSEAVAPAHERTVMRERMERPAGDLRPGDDFNARENFEAYLVRQGWRVALRRGDVTYLARPGKSGPGWSATLGKAAPGVLHVFSTNAAPLEDGGNYDAFRAFAAYEHGGDLSAAAAALAAQGYGAPARPRRREPESLAKEEEPATVVITENGVTPPVSAPEQKPRTPTEWELARNFAASQQHALMYLEGDQWWGYEGGAWYYRGLEVATATLQHWLEARPYAMRGAITRSRLGGILYLAKSCLGPHPLTVFNPDPARIPLANGVLDTRTRHLFPHDPTHRFTHVLPYAYDAAATCPRWLRFLEESMMGTDGEPVREYIETIQEWFGYCLIPDPNRAQVTLVFVGEGGNGKGTATRVLERLVGEGQYAAISVEQLHEPYHRAQLVGKLVGLINEPDRRALQKNGDIFKAITGGDTISARNPSERVFSYRPTIRLTVACNDLPATRDLSYGYFRRLVVIGWWNRPAEPDPLLDEKLASELPGIFNWALLGLARFRERGWRFGPLAESDRLKAEYTLSQDIVRQFVMERCDLGIALSSLTDHLYADFRRWCYAAGIEQDIPTKAGFGMRLTRLLRELVPEATNRGQRQSTGQVLQVRTGIALRVQSDAERGRADLDNP